MILKHQILILTACLAVGESAILTESASDPLTMVAIGRRFYKGVEVEKDLEKAAAWFLRAAELGCVEGQGSIATCYLEGHGVPKDQSKAAFWLEKAASQGDAACQYNLGYLYEHGSGVPQDDGIAFSLFLKSASQGITNAQLSLALCYDVGRGIPENKTEAAKWFEAAAKGGDPKAQFRYAQALEMGIGVIKNLEESFNWYRKSSNQGKSYAQVKVGNCYEKGIGVQLDLSKALEWYRKAADQNDANGLFALGSCFEIGLGTEKDQTKSVGLYEKAVELGSQEATFRLGIYYEEGTVVGQDPKKAYTLFRRFFHREPSSMECGRHLEILSQKLTAEERSNSDAEAIVWLATKGHLESNHDKIASASTKQGEAAHEISKLASEIKVSENTDGVGSVWKLNEKTIYKSDYNAGDPTKGKPSPNGNYIHFESTKLNTDRRSPLVFRRRENTLEYLGDVTNSVIEAINRSEILQKGQVLKQGCYVDVLGWVGPGRLMLSAYGRQPNAGGFEVLDFPCLWDIDQGSFSFSPSSPAILPKVNNFGDNANKESNNGDLIGRKASATKNYSGKVGALAAEFQLTWFPDHRVTGSYFYPTRNPSLKYKLVGKNDVEGELVLDEFTEEKISATIRVSKSIKDERLVWSGIMHNTDGRKFEVSMIGDTLATDSVGEPLAPQKMNPWVFADSSLRLLTMNELRELNSDQLWRARNEIYARNGLIFSTEKGQALTAALGNQYRGLEKDHDIVYARMNKTEKANIEMIKEQE